jgi:aspartate/methionine/tyrosine aminotransferase
LSEPDTEFALQLDRLKGNRDYALDRLRAMGLEPDRPAGGLFVWVPVGGLGLDGRAFAEWLFREYRVQVGPGCAFGPSGVGHIRIGVAGDDGRLREGLGRMAALVERLKNPTAPVPEVPDLPPEEPAEPKPEEAAESPRPTFSRV